MFIIFNSTTAISALGFYPAWHIETFIAQETVVFLCGGLVLVFLNRIEFFFNRLAKYLKVAVLVVSGILFCADVLLLTKFHSILDQAKLEIVLGTNPYTVREFIQMYVFSINAIFVLVFVILMILSFKNIHIKLLIPDMVSKIVVAMSILGIMSISVSYYKYGIPGCVDKILYRGLIVSRVVIDARSAINDLGDEDDINQAFDESKEKIVENESDTPYVIFVLGESADRNKMAAYGYKNNNTPILNKLISAGEAFIFSDTIAPANYTSRAMELIFTFASKGDTNHWYENQNLIDIASAAGYRTVWLSNQSPVGKYGNTDRILANRCAYQQFTNVEGGGTGSLIRPLDEALLPLLDEAMQNDAEKNFYVLHIEGSHEVFNMRYPKEFALFTADDEDGDNETWNKTKAEYDNTILYTDYILGEIVKRFENKNAVIVYISDHGNEVYNQRNFVGHSSEEERNRNMVEIPFIIYGTQKYWENHKGTKKAIYDSVNRPYMTDNIIHFFEDIMKIKTTSYDERKSIINEKFINPVRIYGGETYNKVVEKN